MFVKDAAIYRIIHKKPINIGDLITGGRGYHIEVCGPAILPHIFRVLQDGGRFLVFGKNDILHRTYVTIMDTSVDVTGTKIALACDDLKWLHESKDNARNPHQEFSQSEDIMAFYVRMVALATFLLLVAAHNGPCRFLVIRMRS